jgi:hypothetical protein
MSVSRACSDGLDAGEDVALCKVEGRWEKTVVRIRFGLEPLCPALQKFLLFLGHLLEAAGETTRIDEILAAVGRAKLPDKKGLIDVEDQSLRVIETRWTEMVREIRAGTLAFLPPLEEFMKYVGRYLIGRAEKTPERSWAEKQQQMMWEFCSSRGIVGVDIPIPPRSDEQIREWFAAGKNLIYEPSEEEMPVARLMAALPHRLLVDDPEKIVWEPVRAGRWLLVDAQEHCPRIGERSYQGFQKILEAGKRCMTFRQYALLWYVGNTGGEILDPETDTMLATRYGADSILHAFGRCALQDLRFSVGEWRHTMKKHPKMGVRLVEIIA